MGLQGHILWSALARLHHISIRALSVVWLNLRVVSSLDGWSFCFSMIVMEVVTCVVWDGLSRSRPLLWISVRFSLSGGSEVSSPVDGVPIRSVDYMGERPLPLGKGLRPLDATSVGILVFGSSIWASRSHPIDRSVVGSPVSLLVEEVRPPAMGSGVFVVHWILWESIFLVPVWRAPPWCTSLLC